ncbi:hypothetical protein ANO11243_024740 [Dothideomycetidae sp. 11243]|nr:hypothetical protein ANO11243_024740 [fungal sp. No.11243]
MRSQKWRSSLRHIPKTRSGLDSRQLWHSQSILPTTSSLAKSTTALGGPNRDHVRSYASTSNTSDDAPQKAPVKVERLSRTALRRKDQTSSSSSGVPPPPPIPGWFLKYNVRLQNEELEGSASQGSKALVLQDPYNDAVLITIPYREPIEIGQLGQQKAPAAPPSGEKSQSQTAQKTQATFDFFSPQIPPGESSKEQKHVEEADKSVLTEPVRLSDAAADSDASEKQARPPGVEKPEPKSLPRPKKPLDEATWARLQGQLLIRSILDTAARSEKKTHPRNLIIFTPDHTGHDELDRYVEDVADLASADIIRIDASDIAELAGDYIDPKEAGPGSIGGLAYDAYEGGKASSAIEASESAEPEGVEPSAPSEPTEAFEFANASPYPMDSLRANLDLLKEGRKRLEQALSGQHIVGVSFGMPLQNLMQQQAMTRADSKPEHTEVVAELDRWQRLKLKMFFEELLSAPSTKRAADLSSVPENFVRQKFADIRSVMKHPDRRRELYDAKEEVKAGLTRRFGRKRLANDSLRLHLAHHTETFFGNDMPAATVIEDYASTTTKDTPVKPKGTIIHLRDIHLIYETPHGEDIVKILNSIVRQRQANGESIMIIGSSAEFASDVATPIEGMEDDDLDKEEGFLRLQYDAAPTVGRKAPPRDGANSLRENLPPGLLTPVYPVEPGYRRLLELNLRHIQDLISRLSIPCSARFFSETTRTFLYAPGTQMLGNVALTPAQIQKIVLVADGFRSLYTTSPELEMPHLAIALSVIDILETRNEISRAAGTVNQQAVQPQYQAPSVTGDRPPSDSRKKDPQEQRKVNLDELRRFASKHEQRLFPGIADPANIKITYNDVHVAPETIDALKTATTLSLLRPDAFSYGVLANDRLSGLLLYGPPGTGKTLLAKAVAKDASATVLEVSGAQVYEKYVGEGEKMVRAVFSLAKRLSPCVVFIDEADALFGSRGQNSNRTTHREIINQFLREWDGMDDHSVFMMVATNRPFDLDDAVLRRLPRKILVDLPTAKDRESIMKIHLKGETLDEAVSLSTLAEQTPFYSGSDLKNVCVATALAAVKEENKLQLEHKDDKEFKLPPKRTLTKEHFEKALQEISASISEDMGSLNAIKKFDEKYGDRRGRRKKQEYGFGGVGFKEDESAARVRGDQDQPRP